MAGKTLIEYMDYTNRDFFNIRQVSVVDTYEDGFEVLSSIVIQPYLEILKDNAILVNLTPDEVRKYSYRPQLLSNVLYGTENLYYLILMLNDMTVERFVPSRLYLLNRSDRELVENIVNKERSLGRI